MPSGSKPVTALLKFKHLHGLKVRNPKGSDSPTMLMLTFYNFVKI